MDRGHVHLARKSWDNPILKEPGRRFSKWEAWFWIVSREARGLPDEKNGLGRGEFVASVRELAKRWKWSRSSVQRFLKTLQKGDDPMIKSLGQVAGHSTEHFIICKYETYNKQWDAERDRLRDILNKDKRKTNLKLSRPAEARVLFEIFNEANKRLPPVREFTVDREKKCRTRLRNSRDVRQYLRDFREAIEHANETPFCRGEGEKGWKVSFDWLIENDRNLYKILEGNYDGEIREAAVNDNSWRDVGRGPTPSDPREWDPGRWKQFEQINGPEATKRYREELGLS